MDTRVFWGTLCGLLVFAGLVVFGVAMMFAAAGHAVQQVQVQTQRNIAQLAENAHRQAVADAQRQAAYQQWQQDRRRLAADQRCVGGVVIEVKGNVYTQLGSIAQPIHCDGIFADRPLR